MAVAGGEGGCEMEGEVVGDGAGEREKSAGFCGGCFGGPLRRRRDGLVVRATTYVCVALRGGDAGLV